MEGAESEKDCAGQRNGPSPALLPADPRHLNNPVNFYCLKPSTLALVTTASQS